MSRILAVTDMSALFTAPGAILTRQSPEFCQSVRVETLRYNPRELVCVHTRRNANSCRHQAGRDHRGAGARGSVRGSRYLEPRKPSKDRGFRGTDRDIGYNEDGMKVWLEVALTRVGLAQQARGRISLDLVRGSRARAASCYGTPFLRYGNAYQIDTLPAETTRTWLF
ncbi:hypothetical protein CROQUDRAFT_100604 [Cronartium quercuum f. sp. fusiforme G11]|uniref:Uncharacterized protein n=1 Tax=Cronartium quercuum f. sp. fusiforme G11 TaxID=708437 RepID=A0A9P6N6M1_9BASI|nr:hypothetical protein CROQUDRAFT_100604 [Cronartium quercuum f. sp. fusiforme G11]